MIDVYNIIRLITKQLECFVCKFAENGNQSSIGNPDTGISRKFGLLKVD